MTLVPIECPAIDPIRYPVPVRLPVDLLHEMRHRFIESGAPDFSEWLAREIVGGLPAFIAELLAPDHRSVAPVTGPVA